MVTISRGEALDNLMEVIYGNLNVNFKDRNVIINDDRIRKTLYLPTSINNAKLLLEVTFKETDVKFEDKKKGKSFDFDTEKVIDNTTEYFRSFGIDIPNVVNKTERRILGKRMCNAMIEYILPAIFYNIDTKKGKIEIEADDISFEFNKAVERIKTEFSSGDFFEQLYVDINASEIEKLYDKDFSPNDCNFGVLVCTACYCLFEKYKFIPSICYYCTDNDKKQHKEPVGQGNDTFTELTSKLVLATALDFKSFVSPYYYNPNKENSAANNIDLRTKYKIDFNIAVPSSNFIPRYFYFMTKLDEDIIAKSFPNCKSPDILNQKLI